MIDRLDSRRLRVFIRQYNSCSAEQPTRLRRQTRRQLLREFQIDELIAEDQEVVFSTQAFVFVEYTGDGQ